MGYHSPPPSNTVIALYLPCHSPSQQKMHPCSLWHRKSAAFTVAIYFQLVEWHIVPLVLPRQGITFNIVECSLLVHKEIKNFFQNLSGNNCQAALPSRLVEKVMAPYSSTLAWKIPWTEEPGRLQSMGLRRVRHDWATSLSLFTFMHWRRKWQPTPVFLPGESQRQGSLVGCRLWGHTELDTTDVT